MARISLIFVILLSLSVVVAAQTAPSSVTLTWFGQSTFLMSTSTGLKVLIDPTNPGTYNPPSVEGLDVITVSHEHGDHNYVQMAAGSPLIIRGLTQDDYAKVDQTIKGVRIRTVPAYHDIQNGAQRGRNALFIFEMPGLRIAHLGDLAHKLDPQQVSAMGPIDILLTPMAGGPTMDSKTALEVIDQLKAKVVIPMHYATAASAARSARAAAAAGQPAAPGAAQAGRPGTPGATGAPAAGGRGPSMTGVEEFLKMLDPSVKVERGAHQITFASDKLPSQRTVVVMNYE
jgi:L-ascorbate metabolism protein UlaG (beta-lactamase superfamily)